MPGNSVLKAISQLVLLKAKALRALPGTLSYFGQKPTVYEGIIEKPNKEILYIQ